jgi:hypothetical protein
MGERPHYKIIIEPLLEEAVASLRLCPISPAACQTEKPNLRRFKTCRMQLHAGLKPLKKTTPLFRFRLICGARRPAERIARSDAGCRVNPRR